MEGFFTPLLFMYVQRNDVCVTNMCREFEFFANSQNVYFSGISTDLWYIVLDDVLGSARSDVSVLQFFFLVTRKHFVA